MGFFRRLIDFFTLGSDHPVRRLLAYYLVLAAVVGVLIYFFPVFDKVIGSAQIDAATTGPQVLEDGLKSGTIRGFDAELSPRLEFTLSTLIILMGTLVLMLPVSWVYMSTRYNKGHDQQVAQTLIFLPLVVAGVVLVVQNSLALAFSLAGVVAAVRFRTTLRDTRDVVFIFLAIAVGFAAGVQTLIVAALVSVVFNFVLILTWRYDFGRSVLTPTAVSEWGAPLEELAGSRAGKNVSDRDLVLALDQKQALALAERFARVRRLLGPQGHKPRYNAVLTVTTEALSEAQAAIAEALDQVAGRWRLDEAVSNEGKPSELYYLVRIRKSMSRDDLLTAVRDRAADKITSADVQLSKTTDEHEDKS
ncbi:MAG: DUF4956 domain-containing protein [bacterium]|nr:DUF4956 domain-containing protein [bacterium]